MLFERKAYKKLLEWKKMEGSRSVLIQGAPGVGKTTLAETFARNEYRSFIIIHCDRLPDVVRDAFEDHMNDLDTFFMMLSVEYSVQLYRRESVLIFDDVQCYPRARSMTKYLVADGRYDYIETGCCVNIYDNVKDIVIPSEENKICMYPMDFEEFAWACGDRMRMDYVRDMYRQRKPVDPCMHDEMMLLFKQYMMAGGMPAALDAYLSGGRDIYAAEIVKHQILTDYAAGLDLVPEEYKAAVQKIYARIPCLLAEENKSLLPRMAGVHYDDDAYVNAIDWLADSRILTPVKKCESPLRNGWISSAPDSYRLYMADTGLLAQYAIEESIDSRENICRNILHGDFASCNGMLYENAAAQLLAATGKELFFFDRYSKRKHCHDIRIPFVIRYGQQYIPIALCPGEADKDNPDESLAVFMSGYSGRAKKAYILHTGNWSVHGNVTFLPVYMAGFLYTG